MNRLHILATDKTPEIILDYDSGEISLSGRSIIKDNPGFYNKLLEGVNIYIENPAPITILHVQLDYFGELSSKSLLEIFRKLESIHRSKSDVSINWYYSFEDKYMRETGEDFENLLNIPFRLVELADEI
jgi:hypothetical protein